VLACLLHQHGTVQCSAVRCGASSASACTATGQWAPSPAPCCVVDKRRVLDGVVEGREIPGGVWFGRGRFGRRDGGADRPAQCVVRPAKASQPTSQPTQLALPCTTLGRPGLGSTVKIL
jgi:hypothetical protein